MYHSLYSYLDSWKSNDYSESNQEKKQRLNIKKEGKKIKSDNFKGNREKFNISITILEKITILGTKNYFVFG